MRQVLLGKTGISAGALGLGCMGMSEFYGPTDDASSLRTLERALELGINFFDTSDMYGRGHNETLLGQLIKGRRDKVIVGTKYGFKRDPNGPIGSTYDRDLDNSPAHIKAACDASLKRLGTDYIDVWYAHRYDVSIPIEDVTGAMAERVREGKVRAIGFSEISAEHLRRANAVHPITALQQEYSLWMRDLEKDVLPTCRALGTTLVAYSPLGRGFLAGAVSDPNKLDKSDVRLTSQRFQGENFDKNAKLLEEFKAIAVSKGCTPSQLALAWVCAQGDDIIPIPGTKSIKYLEENVAALGISLSADELAAITAVISPEKISGTATTASQAAAHVATLSKGSAKG